MIVNFELKNWKSFREKNSIKAIPSMERQYNDTRSYIKKFVKYLLPVIGIFGGNASGKSNLIDAIEFLRNMVVNYKDVDNRIPVHCFEFDEACAKSPTEFYLEFLVEDNIYKFTLKLDKSKIIYEKLEYENSNNTHLMYERTSSDFKLGKKLSEIDGMEYIARGTKANRLFISNTIDQQVDVFEEVFDWFRNLHIIKPDSKFSFNPNVKESYVEMLNNFLPNLDTGIEEVYFTKTNVESLNLPQTILDDVIYDLNEGGAKTVTLRVHDPVEVYIFEKDEEGGVVAFELRTLHRNRKGELIEFDLSMESSGTRRAIDIVPAFDMLIERPTVVIIDELDRSLHTDLTKALIEYYLDRCDSENRSQLIFTSHDTNLLSQKIFRRDELYLVDRNQYNESEIYTVSEFKDVRNDHNLESLYLQGRLGGTPNITL